MSNFSIGTNQKIIDSLERNYKLKDRIEKNIDTMWNDIMLPYVSSTHNQILTKLTDRDKSIFYDFMFDNSPAHRKILDTITKQENIITKNNNHCKDIQSSIKNTQTTKNKTSGIDIIREMLKKKS